MIDSCNKVYFLNPFTLCCYLNLSAMPIQVLNNFANDSNHFRNDFTVKLILNGYEIPYSDRTYL